MNYVRNYLLLSILNLPPTSHQVIPGSGVGCKRENSGEKLKNWHKELGSKTTNAKLWLVLKPFVECKIWCCPKVRWHTFRQFAPPHTGWLLVLYPFCFTLLALWVSSHYWSFNLERTAFNYTVPFFLWKAQRSALAPSFSSFQEQNVLLGSIKNRNVISLEW